MNITKLFGVNAYRAQTAAKAPKIAKQARKALGDEVSGASVGEVSAAPPVE